MNSINSLRAKILVLSIVSTFIIIRFILYLYPNADFNLFGYNIHHLYTGIILITLSGIPLILISAKHRIMDLITVVFGIGLSLVLDEWIYLIATDGTNDSYFTPISYIGGIVFLVFTSLYIGILYFFFSKKYN